MKNCLILDCTLRDGGYYNSWDFPYGMVSDYFSAMFAAEVDFVEVGLRSLSNVGFKGGFAYCTDDFLSQLGVPPGLKLGVMVNASELVSFDGGVIAALDQLFVHKDDSPVTLVRIACHIHEFESALVGVEWLKSMGYVVGVNLMQIADRSHEEIAELSLIAAKYPLDVLYFADSMGSMDPEQTSSVIRSLRVGWSGALGIHTHDNMGYALANSLRAVQDGVSWVDGTVTGMGRGPGNVRTEYLVIELERSINITPLVDCINNWFNPLKEKCGWGTNPYYFLAGKFGIHPTYIQEMLADARYTSEDIMSVIHYLKQESAKKFASLQLEKGRQIKAVEGSGRWVPMGELRDKPVLILGAGKGLDEHQEAVESFIRKKRPVVFALNTNSSVNSSLINYRVACHPVRLLADAQEIAASVQPVILPHSSLPEELAEMLDKSQILDFGITQVGSGFEFGTSSCSIPSSLVFAYALAIVSSGKSHEIFLAGFDGYGKGDPRSDEMDQLISTYESTENSIPMTAITPTSYKVAQLSVYGIR